jgi:hypothetical protein
MSALRPISTPRHFLSTSRTNHHDNDNSRSQRSTLRAQAITKDQDFEPVWQPSSRLLGIPNQWHTELDVHGPDTIQIDETPTSSQ